MRHRSRAQKSASLFDHQIRGVTLPEFVRPSVIKEEAFDGILCYRITGKHSSRDVYELWIGKRDLLLRKVRTVSKYEGLSTVEEEIHRNIFLNRPIPSEAFSYQPPIALTSSKQSKRGPARNDVSNDAARAWREFKSKEGRFSLCCRRRLLIGLLLLEHDKDD